MWFIVQSVDDAWEAIRMRTYYIYIIVEEIFLASLKSLFVLCLSSA
jgi:hypothetical protein